MVARFPKQCICMYLIATLSRIQTCEYRSSAKKKKRGILQALSMLNQTRHLSPMHRSSYLISYRIAPEKFKPVGSNSQRKLAKGGGGLEQIAKVTPENHRSIHMCQPSRCALIANLQLLARPNPGSPFHRIQTLLFRSRRPGEYE